MKATSSENKSTKAHARYTHGAPCLAGEFQISTASPTTREECIARVKEQCPEATVANMPSDISIFNGGSFACYCQFGNDFTVGAQCLRVLGAFWI